MERPMGQKAAKRKGKASEIPNATQDAKNKRAITMDSLAQAKEDELELRIVQMMMKDTSIMNDSQRDIHEKYYALGNHDEYFQMRVDATGKMGLSPLQKCTSAIQRFVKGVNVVFGTEYLRKPNNTDVEHLLQMGESRGFPGSNNDINVLNQSNVFNDILEGRAPNMQYTINGTPYNMGEKRKKLFAQHQESARKDVERAFGVLQSRFAIIRGPSRAWHMDTLKHTIYACIILHNMIVEDERHTYGGNFDYSYDNVDINNSTTETFSGPHPNLATRLQRRASIQEKQVHRKLQGDLVEYIWERFGR
ncbi:uncharacterized protein LOC127135730 [Lathyrus oleraceus]|uniref:uncharacterized protein LOC127135730 n=1 Tax=Pisum sativum TaxID=3888 RepID=UPI0021CDF0D0|nr:uncharacterized protein LOC127135730 [Pisum sativum]